MTSGKQSTGAAPTSKNNMTLLRIVYLINSEWPSETSHRRRSVFSTIAYDSKFPRQQTGQDSWNLEIYYLTTIFHTNYHLSLSYLSANKISFILFSNFT